MLQRRVSHIKTYSKTFLLPESEVTFGIKSGVLGMVRGRLYRTGFVFVLSYFFRKPVDDKRPVETTTEKHSFFFATSFTQTSERRSVIKTF